MDPFSIMMAVMSMAASMQQAQQQKKAAQRAAQRQANAAQKEQWTAYEKAEKQRKDQLKKNIAKRRARMGSSGLSAADGSAGAIVQGMRTDAAEASYDSYQNAKENVDDTISGIQTNLLEQSDRSNRKVYNQLGSTAGSMIGSLIED